MATGTAGGSARRNTLQTVGYLRKALVFGDTTAVALVVGTLPAGAIVISSGVIVSTAFNHGTNNLLDIGTSGDPDGFATDLALGTVGQIVSDEIATSNDLGPYASDTVIVATPDFSSTAATTGAGTIYVTFLMNNDL